MKPKQEESHAVTGTIATNPASSCWQLTPDKSGLGTYCFHNPAEHRSEGQHVEVFYVESPLACADCEPGHTFEWIEILNVPPDDGGCA